MDFKQLTSIRDEGINTTPYLITRGTNTNVMEVIQQVLEVEQKLKLDWTNNLKPHGFRN